MSCPLIMRLIVQQVQATESGIRPVHGGKTSSRRPRVGLRHTRCVYVTYSASYDSTFTAHHFIRHQVWAFMTGHRVRIPRRNSDELALHKQSRSGTSAQPGVTGSQSLQGGGLLGRRSMPFFLISYTVRGSARVSTLHPLSVDHLVGINLVSTAAVHRRVRCCGVHELL